MKIERHTVREGTIKDFADEHNLTMVVNERDSSKLPRYYARFKDCEYSDGTFLVSASGDGETEAEAIADYARGISLQRLVFDAYGDSRKEIEAWRFVERKR